MVWTPPFTAVAGAPFLAAEFNLYVRDNFNATPNALATAASQLFVSTGVNTLAARVPATARVDTEQGTTTTTYTNLATSGPSVTMNTGTIAIVLFTASIKNATDNFLTLASVEVTGASSVAASDNWAIHMDGVQANNYIRYGQFHIFTGLTPGSNTFRMRYRVNSGASTGTYKWREIGVIPL